MLGKLGTRSTDDTRSTHDKRSTYGPRNTGGKRSARGTCHHIPKLEKMAPHGHPYGEKQEIRDKWRAFGYKP